LNHDEPATTAIGRAADLKSAARRTRTRTFGVILAVMTDDDLHLLRAAGSESDVPAGVLLIERGQPAAGLFVILDGSVVVEAPEGTTRVLGSGAVIGERGLASESGTRTARVRATSDVRVLAVDRDEFNRLTAEHPSLIGRIAEATA
jgi:CRP-like cAMP-binding protein